MKADPTHQLELLDVAELDSRAAQLRHQRAHLPSWPRSPRCEAERTALTDQVRDARIVVDDLTVEQVKADREVEQVKTRRERDRNRMDTGQITNPKDLERMQHELVSLERRITSLEDAELEVMEALEEAQQVLDGLGIRAEDIDARLAELVTAPRREAGRRSTPRSPRSPAPAARASRACPTTCWPSTSGCASRRAWAPRCCATASAVAAT